MRNQLRTLTFATATVLILLVAACGSSEDGADSSSTTAAVSTTTMKMPSGDSSTTTKSSSTEQPTQALWPGVGGDEPQGDPVALAKAFTTKYLGFEDSQADHFQQGDARSGEVAVRSHEAGPITTVLVRQIDGNDWWVIGATTPNIVIEEPSALAKISSSLQVSGQSTAFEGTVNIDVREDGRKEPLVEGFTNGGANGDMGPFTTTLKLPETGSAAGAVVVRTISPKDGSTDEAAVVRVAFG